MQVKISAIANSDDVGIFWRVDKRLPGAAGFCIERERKLVDGSVRREVLENRAGFEKDEPDPGEHRPSTEWPFQRFNWTDHAVSHRDVVRYRVTPMLFEEGKLAQDKTSQSPWSPWITLSSDAGKGVGAFFNRGLVISQFMSRYLEQLRKDEGLATLDEALGAFKKSLDDHELPIRKFLAGDLRVQMLEMLAETKGNKHHVWAALYELEDEELVQALEKLGSRGHVVLANGSIQPKKGVPTSELRKKDQNKAARKRLVAAGLEVHDRMLSPGALGHNKFVVFGTKERKPLAVWTGSTNWTKTGLCTQINNGLHVKNAAVAQHYLDQWDALRDAESEFPPELVDDNSVAKSAKLGSSKATVWFTRTRKGVDLEAINDVLESAKNSVLFLMFQPGGAGPLGTINKLVTKPKLYVKGVVSTLPVDKKDDVDPDEIVVTTIGDGKKNKPMSLDIIQPQGIARPFSMWAATVTRRDFLSGANKVGFAIIHSKVILVDPFTKPVLITGSHNFSKSASGTNDENFVIIRDHPELALQYATHILAVYQHYRWLNVVYDKQRRDLPSPNALLRDQDTWQDRHLTGASKREMDFWVS